MSEKDKRPKPKDFQRSGRDPKEDYTKRPDGQVPAKGGKSGKGTTGGGGPRKDQ